MLERNFRLKLSGPDYKNKDPVAALADFRSRVANYEKAYEPVGEWEEQHDIQFCKLINVGKKVILIIYQVTYRDNVYFIS